MLRSIDFKTMPYLFTDKAGDSIVAFDGRELDGIYKQVKAMHDQAHSSDDMPTEPGWYVTRDGEDLLSYDGDAWHIHNIDCDAEPFADGDLETMDWSVVKRTFDADAFPLIPVNLNDTSRAERRLTNLTNFLHTLIHECETVRDNPSSDKHTKRQPTTAVPCSTTAAPCRPISTMKTSMTAARTCTHRLATTVWPSERTPTVRRKYRSTSNGRNTPDCRSHS